MPDNIMDVVAGAFIALCGVMILLFAALDFTDMSTDTAKVVTEQATNNSTTLNESTNHLTTSTGHDSFERRRAVWAKRARARSH